MMRQIGWYIPDEHAAGVPEDERLITLTAAEQEGGLNPEWAAKVVPAFIEDAS